MKTESDTRRNRQIERDMDSFGLRNHESTGVKSIRLDSIEVPILLAKSI